MLSLLFTGWLSTDNWTEPRPGWTDSKKKSQSYITTDGQPASLSWNKARIWGLRPDLDYCLTVARFLVWGALSDERTGLPFAIAAGPCQRSLSRVRVPSESRPYFAVSNLRLPFSSPPTTRRVTVEVFDPASTRGELTVNVGFSLYSLGSDHSTENNFASPVLLLYLQRRCRATEVIRLLPAYCCGLVYRVVL
jgi:hypothetical protein